MEYETWPGYFEGKDQKPTLIDIEKMWPLLDIKYELDGEIIKEILYSTWEATGKYFFAVYRHMALVKAMGLPLISVGFGYNYAEEFMTGLSEYF